MATISRKTSPEAKTAVRGNRWKTVQLKRVGNLLGAQDYEAI